MSFLPQVTEAAATQDRRQRPKGSGEGRRWKQPGPRSSGRSECQPGDQVSTRSQATGPRAQGNMGFSPGKLGHRTCVCRSLWLQEAGGKAGRMALRRRGRGHSRGPWRTEEPRPGETAGSAHRARVCGQRQRRNDVPPTRAGNEAYTLFPACAEP